MRRGGGYILRFYFNIYIYRERERERSLFVALLVLIGNSTSAFKVRTEWC